MMRGRKIARKAADFLRNHRLWSWAAALFVLFLSLPFLLWNRPFIEWGLRQGFEAAGIHDYDYHLSECCYGVIAFERVRVADLATLHHLRLDASPQTLMQWVLRVSADKVELPQARAELRDLRVDILPRPYGLRFDGLHAQYLDRQEQPMITPVTLSGEGKITRRHLLATLWAEADGLSLSAEIQHVPAAGEGAALLGMAPLHVGKGKAQLERLFPIAAAYVSGTEGDISAGGIIRWSKEGVAPDITLSLRDVTTETKITRLHGINGDIRVINFDPLTTAPDQRITVALVEMGLPLSDGTLTFRAENGLLHVGASQWTWADGQLATDPFTVPMEDVLKDIEKQVFVLDARHLDLQQLLGMVLEDEVFATGRLVGRIPVRWKNGLPVLEHATLNATEGGTIVYKPKIDAISQMQQDQMQANLQIATKAMENLEFSELSLKMHNFDEDILTVDMHVKGRNPALFDGKAVELNVHLTIEYGGLLESGLHVFQVPKELQQRLDGIGQ